MPLRSSSPSPEASSKGKHSLAFRADVQLNEHIHHLGRLRTPGCGQGLLAPASSRPPAGPGPTPASAGQRPRRHPSTLRRRRDANSEDLPVLTLSRIERFSDQQAQERGPWRAFRDHAQDTPKTCRPPPSCPRWSTAQPAQPRNRGWPSCGLALPWAAPRHPTVLCPVLLVPARRELGMLSCQQAVRDALLSRCRSAAEAGRSDTPPRPSAVSLAPLALSAPASLASFCPGCSAPQLPQGLCTCPLLSALWDLPRVPLIWQPFWGTTHVYLTDGLGLCHIPLPSRPPPPPG